MTLHINFIIDTPFQQPETYKYNCCKCLATNFLNLSKLKKFLWVSSDWKSLNSNFDRTRWNNISLRLSCNDK